MGEIDLSKQWPDADSIIVLDYGSQYNQLITRRIRDIGIYSELLPNTITAAEVKEINPKGIILLVDLIVSTTKAPLQSTKTFTS